MPIPTLKISINFRLRMKPEERLVARFNSNVEQTIYIYPILATEGLPGIMKKFPKVQSLLQSDHTWGKMTLDVIAAKELRPNPDMIGASEPFVTFNYKEIDYKTEHLSTLEPQWNHTFYLYECETFKPLIHSRDYTSPTIVNLVLYYHDKNLAPSFVGYSQLTLKTLEIDDWIPLLEKQKKEGAFKKITKSIKGDKKAVKTKGLVHIKSEVKLYAGVIKVRPLHCNHLALT